MIGFRLNLASQKSLFFDRWAVINAVDKATHQVLSKFGLYVQREARKSIKKAKRKKLSELTPKERQVYRIRQAIGRKKDKKFKPALPFKPSKPGEPHRARTGLIRDFILYSYDPANKSVVIGPSRLSTKLNVPEVLEWGGRNEKGFRIAARPTMQLAMAKKLPELPKLINNAVK